jgi:Xaa-Pro aminopeptidase
MLDNLRREMKKLGIDGFFVPRADEFQGEYVPPSAERLAFATGFTGSAGNAVILMDKAGFFTDGRYTIQAAQQVDEKNFEICNISEHQAPYPTITPTQWIEKHLKPGQIFGIDPWLHTAEGVKKIAESVEKSGGMLKMLDTNPLDAVWAHRPPAPVSPVTIQPLVYSGVTSQEKRAKIAAELKSHGADFLAITAPEDICWLLNVRGGDVPCNPFVLSYAMIGADGRVTWFVDEEKLSQHVIDWVGGGVDIQALIDFIPHLHNTAPGKKIWVDPAAAPYKAEMTVLNAGGFIHAARSPIALMKACKNEAEIDGTIKAHIRDGVAVTRFLYAISKQGAAAKHDEISSSDLLESIRAEDPLFRGLSFDTISGAGGNGAIVHYRATEETKKPLLAGPVYLVDSGAQYQDGTTDITRTLAVDTPNAEMKDRFTRVLKGHIAVAIAVFPEGTTGDKIDALARAPLKEIGLDYAHGTGHGVGSYLSVHEGPCSLSPRNTTVPLMPGMILSNEPGYYEAGKYGIRLENLVTVIDTGKTNAQGKKLFAFETLTLAQFDLNMVDPALLTTDERLWLNAYHARVFATLYPLLESKDPVAAAFLKKNTQPLP